MKVSVIILIIIVVIFLLFIAFSIIYNKFQDYIIRINEVEGKIDEAIREKFDIIIKLNNIIKEKIKTKKVLVDDISKLKDKKIRYTKLIISNENDKTPYCKECKVDIMFDDSVNNCNKMILGGINCYLYRGKNMYDKTPYGNLRVVQNWEELYHEILKLKLSKEGK